MGTRSLHSYATALSQPTAVGLPHTPEGCWWVVPTPRGPYELVVPAPQGPELSCCHPSPPATGKDRGAIATDSLAALIHFQFSTQSN